MSKPTSEGEYWSPVIQQVFLVAAAKDMLAALELIVSECEPGESCEVSQETFGVACAAIAKAKTGRSYQ